jgi:hypothetical protein
MWAAPGAFRSAIEGRENVCQVVELLTMHLAPKQINAPPEFRNVITAAI